MAAITICSDFGAQKNQVSHCFHIYLHEVMGLDVMIFVFWMLSFKPTFSLSSFTFIKRLFSSSLSAVRVVSSAYLRLLIFLPAILIPACVSSSPAFLMMYSAYKINKLIIDGKRVETVSDFIFWGSKITADGDCSHEIKRRLLLGRKVMTNLDSILSRLRYYSEIKAEISLCQERSI